MKYLGGKQRLGKHIAPILLELWETGNYSGYMEPFCGSLGVLKQMAPTIGGNRVIANDYHPDLIKMWQELQDGTLQMPNSISMEEYEETKLLESPNGYKAFVGFGMSFGGKFFGGYAMKYLNNKKEDFCKEMINSLSRTRPLIKDVYFTCIDYRELHPENMFIYCDPPYLSERFPIKYRRDIKYYDEFNTDEFWNIVRKWSKNNMVVVSEMTAPIDFVEIWGQDRYRSACQSKKTRFKDVDTETVKREKLFMHKSYFE
jgi:DNA adenine methylase